MVIKYKSTRQFITTYIILVGLSVFGYFVRMAKFSDFSATFNLTISIISVFVISLIWESLRFINSYLNIVLPFEVNARKRVIVQLCSGVLFGLIFRFFIYFFGEPNLPFKLDSLFVATTWALYIIIPSAINLSFFSIYFFELWKASLVKTERLEKEKSQVQFDNLKNQLNPHFLFNALTSLNSLIFEDQVLASQFLQQLSKVYRYVLQNNDRNYVSLQTEFDFIEHYASLLKTRFREGLNISFDISPEAKERAIVPVTLQILIENAIKHNIVDKEQPLDIDIATVGDYLVVSNTFQPRKRVENSNKMGLENLKSLYRFLTDRQVIIEQREDRFWVKVPLL